MSIPSRIRDFLSPSASPTLRNKPGGMAWINANVDEGEGSVALVNRIVRTVHAQAGGFWRIDPPQVYTITRSAYNAVSSLRVRPGDSVLSIAIHDECLTPIPDAGITDEEVRELYSPKQTEAA